METKEPIKIKLNQLLIILLAILCIVLILAIVLSNKVQNIEQYYIDGKHYIEQEKDPTYGFVLDYKSGQVINTYADYINTLGNDNDVMNLLQNTVNQNFFNNKSLIILEDSTFSVNGLNGHISKISIRDNIANITIKRYEKEHGVVAGNIRTYFIPIDNKNITEVNIDYKFPFDIMNIINPLLMASPFIILGVAIIVFIRRKKKIKATITDSSQKKKASKKAIIKLVVWIVISVILGFILEWLYLLSNSVVYKPIIYLYPKEDSQLSVNLGYKDKITVSYPKYISGWNVLAKPNGDLIDLNTGNNLYSLYYESDAVYNFKVEKDGFIVKGEDIATFLEDKLSILGLSDREKEEFIIYWLPILQKNKYNYIRFATQEEINYNMPLQIGPAPDTLIRVLMTYKGLNKPIKVEEQKLEAPTRNGFVAVEWGGTEIK